MSGAIRLLLVDGLNLVRRVHAASGGGGAGGGVVGSCRASLRRALGEARPSHAACAFDGPGPSWRHRLHPGYKAGHKPMPDDLRASLGAIRAAFEDEGVRCLEVAGTEADDVIATIAARVAARGGRVRILSSDRAFLALLGEGISVRDHFARQATTRAEVVERFGVGPERLLDYWALAGYPSSGIAGVPGIGPAAASRLLAAHGDLDGVLAVASVLPGRAGRALREHGDEARRARDLVRLRTDLELGVNLRDLRFGG